MIKKLLLPCIVLLALFLNQSTVFAQKKLLWEIAPEGGFAWMRNTSLGNLIISTSSGLKGIDPLTGKTNWTIAELAFAPEESFEEIKNTPFIAVSPKEDNNQLFIIEPFEGKILFSSKESNISKIASKYFLYECSAIIIVGYEGTNKEPVMACIDMGTGKKLWSKSSDFSKVSACVAINENEFILSTLFFTYKINAKTGAEVWKQAIDPSFAKMGGLMTLLDKGGANLNKEINALLVKTPFADDLVFMAAQKENKKEVTGSDGKKTVTITYTSFYNAFKVSTGDFAWVKPVQVNQKLGMIIPCKEGLVICAGDKSDVNLLDYNSGAGKWGKKGGGTSVKGGPVTGGALVDDKIMLTSGEKDNFISLLSPSTGENTFPKVKLDGQTGRIVELSNGFLIATNEEVDYINKKTGESFLPKAYESSPSLLAVTDKEIFIFNKKDGLLYSFTKDQTAPKPLTAVAVKFEGKEEPTSIEVLNEGILISSDQNVCLVDKNGKVIYQKYYPAPRESGLKRALLYASAARAAYYSVVLGYTSAVFGATSASIQVQDAGSQITKTVTGDISRIYGNASKSAFGATTKFLEAANKRFTATTQSSDFIYILSEVAKNEYHLIKVSKTSGQTVDDVNFGKNKTPKYELDYIENVIYYEDGGKIKAFRL